MSKFHGSVTARTALVFIATLCAAIGIYATLIHYFTAGYMDRQTNAAIEAEIEGLAEVYRREGLAGLVATLEQRIERDPARTSIYLVADKQRRPLAGNISAWPPAQPTVDGWIEFSLTERASGAITVARTRPFLLQGQVNLLVGREIRTLEETKAVIRRSLLWAMLAAVVAGILVAVMLSRDLRRRFAEIIRTSRDVMQGDLSRRIPRSSSRDDLDAVAASLNAMLDEIQRLLRGIEQVTDNIAHDLRTPLARLRHRLNRLRERTPAAGDELTICIDDIDRLLAVFQALLQIAKLESTRAALDASYFDIAAIARQASEIYAPVAEARDIAIELVLEACEVRGNAELILQAVCNLLDNAIKFSPAGTTVVLGTRTAARSGVISVADAGPGVPADERDRIFERLYRGRSSRTADGSGLGLSVVRAIADYHRAAVVLPAVDNGLTIELHIPLGDPNFTADAAGEDSGTLMSLQ